MLFARKSRWKDLTGGIRQYVAIVGSSLSLWKTSIQTIEARHGKQLHDSTASMQFSASQTTTYGTAWQGVHGLAKCTTCWCAGSNVSLTLYFLRFAMGINVALAAFWLAGTVVPFIISPPSTFSWQYLKAYRPTDLLQGYGLHNTFLLYGKYQYEDGAMPSRCMLPL